MSCATVFICICGFLFFGLATEAHHRRRCSGALSARRCTAMRVAGWSSLVAAFLAAVVGGGWDFGPVRWMGAVMLGAGAAFLLLNFAPAWMQQSFFVRR